MLHSAPDPLPDAAPAPAPPEFSLVRGGPLFRIWRRAHASGTSRRANVRRVLLVTLLVWLPLAVLSIVDGLGAGTVRIPFFHDVETQVRFLLALPLLIVAEDFVDERISPLVRKFAERRIIRTEDLPAFNAAVTSALRIRDSPWVEAALLVLVYTLGLWVWRSAIAPDTATWYARPVGTALHFSRAGYWNAFVAIPIFQFVLLRWYLRLLIWFQLLWRVSKLDLQLIAAHPDGAGGIGFLGETAYAFSLFPLAQGALLAGVLATRILYQGDALTAYKGEAFSWILGIALFILGPLLMFSPQMERARRKGRDAYGWLASDYIQQFEHKWLRHPSRRALLGTSDIQSLADLGNSHHAVRDMRIVPFGRAAIVELMIAAAIPLLPLTLTMFSVEELLGRLFKLLFA